MSTLDELPDAAPLGDSERLALEPLRAGHAGEMASLLDDIDLHTFVGGEPETEEQLRARYLRQSAGRSPDGSQRWLNWVVRDRTTGRAVGTTQATVGVQSGRLVAEVAWVIGSRYQRRGYAKEAAQAMARWLRAQGVQTLVAHVHPGHVASIGVARAIGLARTGEVVDGEVCWRS